MVQSIPKDLREKLKRRELALRDVAQRLRRLAQFDAEINDAIRRIEDRERIARRAER